MPRINLSRTASVAVLGTMLILFSLTGVQAEEKLLQPLLLEEGGNLSSFDPITMTLDFEGQRYRIDPTHTQVIVISAQGRRQLSAGKFDDLAQRLDRFRGRPLSFQSTPDGKLKLIILDETLAAPADR